MDNTIPTPPTEMEIKIEALEKGLNSLGQENESLKKEIDLLKSARASSTTGEKKIAEKPAILKNGDKTFQAIVGSFFADSKATKATVIKDLSAADQKKLLTTHPFLFKEID